jgi:hypothetical protein
MDLEDYSEDELLEAGREAIKREQWPRATTMLAAYVARYASRGETVPASGLASYALCLGHGKELRRGLELCKKAQHAAPRNAHVYWCLAQLHLLAHSRKDAIEVADRGLRAVPDNFMLLRLRKRLGLRQSPPLPFLDRKHGLNVRLGRLMHRIKGSPPAVLPA